ncbi:MULTISPECIES: PH domain-containing protein [Bacillus cereus group]|uniref:PH domain-containing protein n=1 Tax=Bacillus cereus group TaxID=86661 RepID=UPI0012989B7F|nr:MULTISPECIES: PH domain-containing protein [Bacillus cereus group]MCR6787655.1 PH domain-containing protein [Bacillus thuringiensis]MCR6822660.1 PH domain-containing protein [Bacillus thuringiensis]MCR6829731.1 PH domain-containing protein [Bacillus thuringiensis]MEB8932291.1 PH domain-containing protein [Bacillus cereus]MEB9325455.1 PH domain-containing protein [Bacillus cereus]
MKANLGTIKEHLNSKEDILSTIYCVINFGYISRSGILAATNKKSLFCSDAMFGKGLKWEFLYTEIQNFNHTDGVVLEMSAIPFIKKITMNYKDDFIVFDNFSNPQNVQSFFELVQSKQ